MIFLRQILVHFSEGDNLYEKCGLICPIVLGNSLSHNYGNTCHQEIRAKLIAGTLQYCSLYPNQLHAP